MKREREGKGKWKRGTKWWEEGKRERKGNKKNEQASERKGKWKKKR